MSLGVSERYLRAFSIMHMTISLASNVTNDLFMGCCIRERRLAVNDIELGNNACCYAVGPIKNFVEYAGTNRSIQVPLLVIDQR